MNLTVFNLFLLFIHKTSGVNEIINPAASRLKSKINKNKRKMKNVNKKLRVSERVKI